MNHDVDVLDPREERLYGVLDAYLEAVDSGWAPDRGELVACYPDLADDLGAFLKAEAQVAALAYPAPAVTSASDENARPLSNADTTAAPADKSRGDTSAVGPYEALAWLGSGAMGDVFRAYHKRLRTWHALKKIRRGRFATRADVRRFLNDAQAAASLHHPHIVRIFEVGEDRGQPYFSMMLLEHGSLESRLADLEKDPRATAKLLAKIARAVHHAHMHGLIHRDLKPANIMLDGNDEPHVIDFGLAKSVAALGARPAPLTWQGAHDAGLATVTIAADDAPAAETPAAETPAAAAQTHKQPSGVETQGETAAVEALSHAATRQGSVLGTWGYMPPEHCPTRDDAISVAADVYSLGAILYRVLAGERRFSHCTRSEEMARLHNEEPASPQKKNPSADPTLSAICAKCLQRDPANRYSSALALAEDLEDWLKGDWPRGLAPPRTVRVRRALRRYWLTGLLAVIAVAALTTAALVVYYADPDRVPRSLESQARRGPVTLIGETGHPRWWRWNLGEGTAMIAPEKDEAFSFATLEDGRLELLRSTPAAGYRYSVEIRHDRAFGRSGLVGMYFGHSQQPREEGPVHYWWDLTFADVGDQARFRPGPDPTRKYAEIMMTPRRRHGPPDDRFVRLTDVRRLFLSAAESNTAPGWREVAIEVTPEKIRFFWQGQRFGDLTPAQLRELGEAFKPQGKLVFPEIEFDPAGALGLYVSQGKASFRNASVTPLR